MEKYNIVITETLQRVVSVPGTSAGDAEQRAKVKWCHSGYVLGAEDYVGVEIIEENRARAHRTGNKGKGDPGHER